MLKFEPPHDKTNKMTVRPAKTQISLSLCWAYMPFCWFCHEVAHLCMQINGPRQANLVLIAYASSQGSGEPAHPRSLARTFAARSYKQWIKRNLQTESQIPGPAEWLGMRSWNLSWRNARRHKFAWRGSNIKDFFAFGMTLKVPQWLLESF